MGPHITRVTNPHHTLHQWVGGRGHGEEGGLADGYMESACAGLISDSRRHWWWGGGHGEEGGLADGHMEKDYTWMIQHVSDL